MTDPPKGAYLTSSQLAVSQGHIDIVKYLLNERARVNAMNDFGE